MLKSPDRFLGSVIFLLFFRGVLDAEEGDSEELKEEEFGLDGELSSEPSGLGKATDKLSGNPRLIVVDTIMII